MKTLNAWEWIKRAILTDKNHIDISSVDYVDRLQKQLYFKKLAIQSSINLIANAISLAEFQTFEKGKNVKNKNYYLFNVEPNNNNSASKFWRKVIHKLIYENACLIIQQNDFFYVADSFTTQKKAFLDNIYKDIVIEEYQLNKIYSEKEVIHLELHDEKIKMILDGAYETFEELLEISKKKYKKAGASRGILNIDTLTAQKDKDAKKEQELMGQRFKRFFEAENGSVMPLSKGLTYTDITKSEESTSRDIKALIEDIFYFTAIAFQIPPQLLLGNVADTSASINSFINLCIRPIAELITDEINRKYYGRELVLQKNYVKIDTSRIKISDIKDIAGALDILFRIGAHTINDNRELLGKETFDHPLSDEIFVTKNYMRLSDIEKETKNE